MRLTNAEQRRLVRYFIRRPVVVLCDEPMYDADGGPKCQLPRLHIWDRVNLGDDHMSQIGPARIAWQFTYCWQFHDAAQREAGWACLEPVGHAVTEPLSAGS